MKKQSKIGKRLKTAGVYMSVVVGGGVALHADPATNSAAGDAAAIQKLSQENQDLKSRLDALEAVAQKEGLMPSGSTNADPPVAAMTDITLSGFVTSSYFHDTSEPPASNGHISPGYLWNRVNDNFSLNKVKITLASPPVEASGEKFDVAYRVSLIFGQDAPIVNSGFNGGTRGAATGFNDVREAYIEMNVPVGTGLNVRAGELISLLNYESGDGGAANQNFSQGFQWFFTGNGPADGVQLGYDVNSMVGVKVRVSNGLYAGPIDNNSSKSFMGAIDLKPYKDLWVNLLGFGGREDVAFAQDVYGGEILAGWKATSQLNFGTELDYFDFYNPHTAAPADIRGNSSVYSGGLWTDYAFTKEYDLALRAEYLSDKNGVDASGGALGLLNPFGTGQDITSVALTLNYTPISRIKIQPEIRYDHTSFPGGWVPGKRDRVIFGAGASYLF
jgi:hypothetical protein